MGGSDSNKVSDCGLRHPEVYILAEWNANRRSGSSQRQFNHLITTLHGPNRQTSCDRFTQIETQFLHRLPLCGAAGDGGHLDLESACFSLVHDGVNLHTKSLVEAAGVEPASEKARREKNYV